MDERGIGTAVVIAIVVVVVAVAGVAGYLLLKGEAGFKTYANENYHFKFDYPENWIFSGGPVPPYDYLVASFGAVPENRQYENNLHVVGLQVYDRFAYVNSIEKYGDSILRVDTTSYLSWLGGDLTDYLSWLENGDITGLTSFISYLENGVVHGGDTFLLRSKPVKIAINNHYGVRVLFTVTGPFWSFRIQEEQVVVDNYLYLFHSIVPENSYPAYASQIKHEIDSFSLLD